MWHIYVCQLGRTRAPKASFYSFLEVPWYVKTHCNIRFDRPLRMETHLMPYIRSLVCEALLHNYAKPCCWPKVRPRYGATLSNPCHVQPISHHLCLYLDSRRNRWTFDKPKTSILEVYCRDLKQRCADYPSRIRLSRTQTCLDGQGYGLGTEADFTQCLFVISPSVP